MIITADGTFKIVRATRGASGNSSIIYLSGTLGGATVQLAYLDSLDNHSLLTNGTLSPGEQYIVEHGSNNAVYALVTGATGTTNLALDAKRRT